MTHIDDAALAGHVLRQRQDTDLVPGDEEALTPEQQRHLQSCRQCQQTADELRGVLVLAGQPMELSTPSLDVWQRIEAEVLPPAAEPDGAAERSSRPATMDNGDQPARRGRLRRRPMIMTAVAAALGLIVGVVGTIVVDAVNNRDQVVETARLAALPGKTGQGTAELVKTNGATMLRVSVDVPPDPGAFHELWLINRDGRRMQDLGVLPPDGEGDYPLPSPLQSGLRGYTIVDVSIEPFDGNPAHSLNSVVRGQLAG